MATKHRAYLPCPYIHIHKEEQRERMSSLKPKDVTRITVRVYDTDFAKELSDFYLKTGGTQNDYVNILLRLGLAKAKEATEEKGKSIDFSTLMAEFLSLEAKLDDLEKTIEAEHIARTGSERRMEAKVDSALAMESCNYHLNYLVEPSSIRDEMEKGGLDGLPARFRKRISESR